MKVNYKRNLPYEMSIAFRIKKNGIIRSFGIYQNTLYDRIPEDNDIVYLDFENDEQIDKLINTLQELKKMPEEKADENNTES